MTGMDMGKLNEAVERSQQAGGIQFGDIERLVIVNGLVVRVVGTMGNSWEHFAETPKGQRPFYCGGPETDCPMCKLVTTWAMSEDVTQQKKASDMKAKEKFYFNVLDRSDAGKAWHEKNKHSKVLVQNVKGLNIGSMLLQSIGQTCQMRKQQGQDPDPNTFDIAIMKTGTGLKTIYAAQFVGNVEPLTKVESEYGQYDLNELSKSSTLSEIDAAVSHLIGAPIAEQAAPKVADEPVAPPPAAAAPPAAVVPPAPPPAVAPPAPVAPAASVVEYADTTPQDGYDPHDYYHVPCSGDNCGANMQVAMKSDGRQLKCHKCGKIYANPGIEA